METLVRLDQLQTTSLSTVYKDLGNDNLTFKHIQVVHEIICNAPHALSDCHTDAWNDL